MAQLAKIRAAEMGLRTSSQTPQAGEDSAYETIMT